MEPENNNEAAEETPKSVLHKVTPLSKYLAMILFILLPFIGGWVGYMYAPEKVVEVEKSIYMNKPPLLDVSVEEIETEVVKNDNGEIKFLNPKREGSYTFYDVDDGVVTGEWTALYGPNTHGGAAFYFFPDISQKPMSDRFLLRTNLNLPPSDMELFNVDLNKFDSSTEDCSLEGGRATIKISQYAVLEAEMGATDYALINDVVGFSSEITKKCR